MEGILRSQIDETLHASGIRVGDRVVYLRVALLTAELKISRRMAMLGVKSYMQTELAKSERQPIALPALQPMDIEFARSIAGNRACTNECAVRMYRSGHYAGVLLPDLYQAVRKSGGDLGDRLEELLLEAKSAVDFDISQNTISFWLDEIVSVAAGKLSREWVHRQLFNEHRTLLKEAGCSLGFGRGC